MKTIEFTEIPVWKFKIDEISAGEYKVAGKDNCDRSVEKIGFDMNVLLEECKGYARLNALARNNKNSRRGV